MLVLGGRATPSSPTEAEAGRQWLLARGLEAGRIGVETRSRHTLENLRNHREAHPPGTAPEALVTSRLHLLRAAMMARRLGLCVTPVAAEAAPHTDLPRLLAEGFMVHWYVTGRILARLLHRPAWLARVE